MANQTLFASTAGARLPRADGRNHHGAPAYVLEPRQALAQLAATGALNGTFYASAEQQLEEVLIAASLVDAEFVAKTAIWARQRGHMKDMPALLLALLSTLPDQSFGRAFRRVVDNGKMLRNFVQIMRSGVVGRKSLGTRPKRMVQEWLERATPGELLRASVGQSPSLADVIRMVHPHPADPARAALYAYFIGKPYDVAMLPEEIQAFETFKRQIAAGKIHKSPPDVPFQLLTALPLTTRHWVTIAERCGWQALRMNLMTFARHGVFANPVTTQRIASRLADPREIERARVFPYQLLAAYAMTGTEVPAVVREALQKALELAIGNVPVVAGKVVVCPDVSGSMSSPVTGVRKGATTAVRCIDVAALVAAAILRANRSARVLPFAQDVVTRLKLNAHHSVMQNAAKLAGIGGGGTNCSAPLRLLNAEKAAVDLVVFVSDNESWMDTSRGGATAMMAEWRQLKSRNPGAKLVCIDIQPYTTTQAQTAPDILNVGGFSDAVFDIVAAFAKGTLGPDHWVGEIERITL